MTEPDTRQQRAAQCDRRSWMSILAKSERAGLERALAAVGALPSYEVLRGPERGSVMVRARAGGTGELFNLGEMTVTRATVELRAGDGVIIGTGYVAGRSHIHAELAALCDALLQTSEWRERIFAQVIGALQRAAHEGRVARLRGVQPTKVEFFTVARGDGA